MKKLIFLCMLLMGHLTLSTAQENAGGGILFHENEQMFGLCRVFATAFTGNGSCFSAPDHKSRPIITDIVSF